MEEKSFEYQRWNLRMFSAAGVFLVVYPLQMWVASLLEASDLVYTILFAAMALAGIGAFYKITERWPLFLRRGAYWIDGGAVHVRVGRKTYKLSAVKWLRGTTVSAYGFAKAGMLVVQTDRQKLVLVSPSTPPVRDFGACGLMELFEAIRLSAPEMKEEKELGYWYEA